MVLHRDEVRKPTNTGQLAARCLQSSEVLVHGNIGETVAAPWEGDELDAAHSLLLFPCEEATPLGAEHLADGPVRLVVPDGTWRQASKMTRRIEWMATLPKVGLPVGDQSSYRLRSEPKAGGLATMEAIARAFGVLEGHIVQDQLEEIFRIMIDRTLYCRGQLKRSEVFGGIAEGVVRHDPRSGS